MDLGETSCQILLIFPMQAFLLLFKCLLAFDIEEKKLDYLENDAILLEDLLCLGMNELNLELHR